MKKNTFLKTLLSAVMAFSTISTAAVSVLAEDTDAELEETILEETAEAPEAEVAEAPEAEVAEAPEAEVAEAPEAEVAEAVEAEETVSFYEELDDVTVSAEAAAGVFPAGTEMSVFKVEDEAILELAASKVGENAQTLVAVDITFTFEGEEIQPDGDVRVTISSKEIEAAEEPVLVHVDDKKEDLVPEIVKQIEEETPAEEVTADLDSFSIYAIVDPGESGQTDSGTFAIKYEFYTDNTFAKTYKFQNEEGVETYVQYVSNGTGVDEGDKNDTLINPGAPTDAEHGVYFSGWYSEADELVIPADKVSVIISNVTENKTVKLYPKYDTIYYIEYYDENSVIYKTESTANEDFTVSGETASLKEGQDWRVSYQPDSSTQAFQGWTTEKGSSAVIDTVSFAGVEDRLVKVYPYSAEVYWISFDKNDLVDDGSGNLVGSGALYVAPIYVLQTDATVGARYSELPTTERPGYTFAGWFENPDGTGAQLSLSTAVNKNVTYYAKWVPASTQYTIVYWRQYASDAVDATDAQKTYYYDGSVTKYANTGSSVSLTNADTNTAGTGFKYNQTKSDTDAKEVRADGSTALNVYYDRQDYTLTFKNGNNYSQTYMTIHELYQHNIADRFSGGYRWLDYKGVRYATDRVLVMIDIMPDANIEFRYSSPGNRPHKYMYYDVEALPGTTEGTSTYTYNGETKTFVNYAYVDARYNMVTEKEDYIDLIGFTKWTTNPRFNSNGVALEDYYNNGTIHMYYTRNSYNLEFVDSFNNQAITTASVLYELPLTEYENYFTVSEDSQTITQGSTSVSHEGYEFKGWYADPACTQPFDFSAKMTAAPIKVYAGWQIRRFRVWIQPNGGVLSPTESTYFRADWGELIQEYADVETTGRNYYATSDGEYSYVNIADPVNTDFARVAYYKKTSDLGTVTITDEDTGTTYTYNEADHTDGKKYKQQQDVYEFVGWYKVNKEIDDNIEPVILENDPISIYNFNSPVKEATAIRAIWKRVGTFRVSYDANMYKDYKEGEGWQNVDVAKNDSAVVPADTDYAYGDLASAIAGAAPTVAPEGYIFVGWKTPAGDIIQHNDVFTIYSALSVMNNPETSHEPEYTYTLSAVYSQIGTTKVTYDINLPTGAAADEDKLSDLESLYYETKELGGSPNFDEDNVVSALVRNSKLQLSEGEGFVVPGYGLKGWNDDEAKADEGKVKFDLGETYAIGAASKLYAVWGAPEFYVYHSGLDVASATTENPIVEKFITTPGQKFDIVAEVTTGLFYGGYYSDYAGKGDYKDDGQQPTKDVKKYDGSEEAQIGYWDGDNAFLEYGKEFLPVDGETYYLKELQPDYLTPKTKYVYNTYRGNVVTKLFMLSVIDDANYQSIEFVNLNGTDEVAQHITRKYSVKGPAGLDLKPEDTENNMWGKYGYIVVWNVKETTPAGIALADYDGVITGYMANQKVNQTLKLTTYDGVIVTRATRVVTVGGTDFAKLGDITSKTTNKTVDEIVYTKGTPYTPSSSGD